MTRKKQILEAFDNLPGIKESDNPRYIWREACEWADQNPITSFLEMMHQRSIAFDSFRESEIQLALCETQLKSALSERDALKAKLAEAVGAMKAFVENDWVRLNDAKKDIEYALAKIEATGEAPVASEHASGMLTSKIETTGSEGSEK